MKRILWIILCGCLVLPVQAQASYRIYAVKGKVMVKTHDLPQWQRAELDLPLQAMDSIRIQDGGAIRIVSELQHNIYSAEVTGLFAVLDYVDIAKSKNSNRVSKGVIREIKTGRQETIASHQKKVHTMAVLGTGSRSVVNDPALQNLWLAMVANKFAWIGAQACSGQPSPTIEGVTFIRNKVDGEWSFEFENNSDKDYYINVLHINKRTNIVSLCYVLTSDEEITSCPITPSGYSACMMDVLYPDTPDDVYVLVATEREFDTEAMDNELIYHPIDKAKEDSEINVQYMW